MWVPHKNPLVPYETHWVDHETHGFPVTGCSVKPYGRETKMFAQKQIWQGAFEGGRLATISRTRAKKIHKRNKMNDNQIYTKKSSFSPARGS